MSQSLRAAIIGLGTCALWPLTSLGTITSSGDASIIPPGSLPSYLFAGQTGTGSLSISGNSPASFPVVYLGTTNPTGPATATSSGTLSIDGAIIGLNSLQGNGPGTALLNVTGNSQVASSAVNVAGSNSEFMLTDSTFNTGNFLTSLSLGATLTATNSTLRTGLNMTSGSTASFFNSFLGDLTNFSTLNVGVASTATAAGALSFGGNSNASVKDVRVGVAVSGPSLAATFTVLNSAFTASRLTIGDGDSLFDPVEGSGAVTIENSILTLRDSLDVGSLAPGRLELKGTATASIPRVFVGGFDPRIDDRELSLNGTSSLTVGTSIEVRGGNILMAPGTTLTSNGTTKVGTNPLYDGEMDVNAGFFDSVGLLTVGAGGAGSLGILDPFGMRPAPALTLRTNAVVVGSGVGGNGLVSVIAGVGAQMNDTCTLGLSGGRGQLDVSRTARLGTAAMRVGGSGGTGILNVLMGGQLSSSSARVDGSAGLAEISRATIEGEGSRWDVPELKVSGHSLGTSVVEVGVGGTLATNIVQLGFYSPNGAVTIDGGTWTNASVVEIGSCFAGSALLDHGGSLVTDALVLGNPTQSSSVSGQLDLRGGSNVTVTNGFSLGRERNSTPGQGGHGQLTVEGATLTTSGGAFIGYSASGSTVSTRNTVEIGDGGVWNTNGGFIVGDGNLGEGVVTVGAGGSLINTTGTILARGASGTLLVDGNFSTADNLVIGERGHALFFVQPGASVATASTYLGQDAGSFGEVYVTSPLGAGGSIPWTNSGSLVVGRDGEGFLDLANGAVTRVTGAVLLADGATTGRGELAVESGSDFRTEDTLQVGRTGLGYLEVLGGSYVESHGNAYIGLSAGAQGIARLDGQTAGGVRSTWNIPDGALGVGESGFGRLDVIAGARMTSIGGNLGTNPGGSGTVNISTGGGWTTADLLIGNEGQGAVTLTGYSGLAVLTSTSGVVGRSTTGVGQINLNGAGAAWLLSGDLTLGEAGRATTILADGASIQLSAGDTTLGRDPGSSAILNFSNGAFLNSAGSVTLGTGHSTVALTSGSSFGSLDFTLDSGSTETGAQSSQNQLTLADSGTFLTTGNLFTGGAGINNFSILSGAIIYATQVSIGGLGLGGNPASLNNTAVVSGGGAELNVSGALDIGTQLPGRLNVEDTGLAVSSSLRVGLFTDGSLLLRSGGLWNGEYIQIYSTPNFASRIDLTGGARLTANGPVTVGLRPGNFDPTHTAQLTVNGTGSVASPPEISAASVLIGRDAVATATLLGRATLDAATTTVGGHGQLNVTDGIVDGALAVESGGVVSLAPGTLLVTGDLVNDAGGRVTATGNSTLTVQECVTNNGLMQFTGGANFVVTSNCFTNNGVIDIMTAGSFNPGPGFVNNGVILDSSTVKVKSITRSGGVVALTIDGYTGHTYRLQRSLDLAENSFIDIGPAQAGATGVELIFSDPDATGTKGFYRIALSP